LPADEVVPRISVITPAYNAAPYLAECVESVRAQSVDDLEMVIIDDGSTDATAAVSEAYTRRDRRVRSIHGPNRGVSAARNAGMATARGEYFAFIDADDTWAPTFLEEQLAILEARPEIAVVTGNARNRGGALEGQLFRLWPGAVQELRLLDMIENEDVIFIMSVFRRTVYDRIGGFDETRRHNEDYQFWLRAATAGFRFVANPAPLATYRRHEDSASANEPAMLAGIVQVLDELRGTCDPHGAECAAIDRQVTRFKQEYLASTGKRALLAGEFPAAADCFQQLYRSRGGARLAALSAITRWCPRFVRQAYQVRLAHLQRAQLRTPSGSVRRPRFL
jgi:glycosyltransferase involved in cell wall biosynthesis